MPLTSSSAKFTWYAIAIVFSLQVLLVGLYYPKWQLSGTEATISWDVAGYYMYLPAAFIYKDLGGDSYHAAVTEAYRPSPVFDHAFKHEKSGAYVMKYSIGQAIQFAPFFAVAHIVAKFSSDFPADGFSRPYQLGITAEILFFALLGLLLLRVLLLRYFSELIAACTIIAIGVGTNYLEYSSMGGGHTHLNLFAVVCAVALLSDNFYKNPKITTAGLLGGLIGLAALTRPTEIMLVLLPLLWGIRFSRDSFYDRLNIFKNHWLKFAVAAIVGGMVLALQPLYWKLVAGEWIVYSYQDQGFSFLSPHIWKGMFSARAGWLTYTPLGIFMLAGFFTMRKELARLTPTVAIYIAIFCYIVWSWDIWWYGGSLGQRTMVQVYPLLALPLGSLFAKVARAKWPYQLIVGVGISLCILINLFWTHQAHRGGMLRVGEMTWPYYLATLGRFDQDFDRLKLLDGVKIYKGELGAQEVLLTENFEQLPDSTACPGGPISGNRSLCVSLAGTYSPDFYAPRAPAYAEWLRVSFDVDVRNKTWESWAMLTANLYTETNGNRIKLGTMRPERIVNAGRSRLHFDVDAPSAKYEHLVINFAKHGLAGELAIDSLTLTAFAKP